jgi:arylformamidase
MKIEEIFNQISDLKVTDLSPTFATNMPGWPTHPPMGIIEDGRNFDQNGYFAQTLVLSEHTGSHVDAPAHIHASMHNFTIDTIPLNALIGVCKKYDLKTYDLKAGEVVTLNQIKAIEREKQFSLNKDDIVLVEFGWDKYYRPESHNVSEREWWAENTPGMAEEVCKYFAEKAVKAVGSDTVGCDDCVKDGVILSEYGHEKYFLPNHILIIEDLKNLALCPTVGIFVALPLKIKGGSGSPIRPIVFG